MAASSSLTELELQKCGKKKKLRQTKLVSVNGKLTLEVPSVDIKEEHTINIVTRLPCKFESNVAGAVTTDLYWYQLPPQILSDWEFFLTTQGYGYTSLASIANAEYLIKLHGGRVIQNEDDGTMQTIVVECDRAGYGVYWFNGRRVYSANVIFEHIETERVMTRETLDNLPLLIVDEAAPPVLELPNNVEVIPLADGQEEQQQQQENADDNVVQDDVIMEDWASDDSGGVELD